MQRRRKEAEDSRQPARARVRAGPGAEDVSVPGSHIPPLTASPESLGLRIQDSTESRARDLGRSLCSVGVDLSTFLEVRKGRGISGLRDTVRQALPQEMCLLGTEQ